MTFPSAYDIEEISKKPDQRTEAKTPTREAASPTARLMHLLGAAAADALQAEGLVVIDADSPRAIWHDSLSAARTFGRYGDVAELITVGAARGWV